MADLGKRRPSRRRRLSPRFLAVLLVLAAVSAFLHVEKFHRGKYVLMLQHQYASLVETRPMAKTKAQRVQFYKTQYYLGYPVSISYAAADLVRRVDGIAPPLRLLAVQVDPGLHDLDFKLTVGIEAATLEAAQRKFAAFLEKVRNVPGIFQTESYAPSPAAGESGLHVFTTSGRAEFQP
jgi:hypothetical protein